MSNQVNGLPPEINQENQRLPDRVYRTALSPSDYLALEQLGMKRNLKPYGYTKTIVTLYLHGQMVLVSDLPEELRGQVQLYLESKKA